MAAGKDTGKDMAQGLGGRLGAQQQGAGELDEDDDAEELRILQEQYEAAQRKSIEKREAKAKEAQRLLEEAAARVAGAGGLAETSEEPEDKSISSMIVYKMPAISHELPAVAFGMAVVDKFPVCRVTSRLLAYKKAGIEVEVLVLDVGRYYNVFDTRDKK